MTINFSTVPTMLKAIYLLTLGCHGGSQHQLILINLSFLCQFVLDFVYTSA